MSKNIWTKTLAVSMAGALLLSVITSVPFSRPFQAAAAGSEAVVNLSAEKQAISGFGGMNLPSSVADLPAQSVTNLEAEYADNTVDGGIYEAEENTILTGSAVASNYSGFSGTGYVDFQAATNAAIEWKEISVAAVGTKNIIIRYALQTGTRNLDVYVNGTKVISNTAFAATGSWSIWDEKIIQVPMNSSINTLKLVTTGTEGPNVDSINVTAYVDENSTAVKEAVNPYLPLWEHIPDGEPRIFEDPDNPGKYRVYIYGSHDTLQTTYCGYDLVTWSAPVDDLTNWRFDGKIFESIVNGAPDVLYAPDMVEVKEPDGSKSYYLYPNSQGSGRSTMVAKSKRPDGPFEVINWKEGSNQTQTTGILGFDPAAFVDDDGRVYGYWGYQRSYAAELDPSTMSTVKPGTSIITDMIGNSNDTPAGNMFRFFEASSLRKVEDKYVLVYSRKTKDGEYGLSASNNTLAYAYGDTPLGPWTYGGTIVDARGPVVGENGAITASQPSGNTHGSILEINGQWYVFYHRSINNDGFSRQGMVAPIQVDVTPDGKVVITGLKTEKDANGNEYTGAEVTSDGFQLSGLDPFEYYSAGIASFLRNNSFVKATYDTWQNDAPVVNNKNNSIVGYKYINFDRKLADGQSMLLELYVTPKGVDGTIDVMMDSPWTTQGGKKIGTLNISKYAVQQRTKMTVSVPDLDTVNGKHGIYFVFRSGSDAAIADLNGLQFSLAQASLLDDTFTTGLDNWTILAGTPSVDSGLMLTNAASLTSKTGKDWRNYEFVSRVNLEKGSLGLRFLQSDETNYYQLRLEDGNLELSSVVNGTKSILGIEPGAFHTNEASSVSIAAVDYVITVRINGIIVIQLRNSDHEAGAVGISSYEGTSARISSVLVQQSTEGETSPITNTVSVNGVPLSGFAVSVNDFSIREYSYTVPAGTTTVPTVTAASSDKDVKVSIAQADNPLGTAVVRFFKGEQVKTYKVFFSSNETVSFEDGLPAGWKVLNPANPANPKGAIATSGNSVSIQSYKGDSDYPNGHDMLEMPYPATSYKWAMTVNIQTDKPLLNSSSLAANTQAGIAILQASNSDSLKLNAINRGSTTNVNTVGKSGTATFSNNSGTALPNPSGSTPSSYWFRLTKNGLSVQGSYSIDNGATWRNMGGLGFYDDFFKNAKLQLYTTNLSTSTDLKATYTVNLVMSNGESAEGGLDQQAVEQAAALIGNRITVQCAAGDDAATLKTKAQEALNNNKELESLGVTSTISYENGHFKLSITKGAASIIVNSLTIIGEGTISNKKDFEDQTLQGFKPKGDTVTLTPSQEANHTPGGAYALKVTGRTANSDGPSVNVKDAVKTGNEYNAAVWVKLISPSSAQLKLSAIVNTPTPYSISLATQTASSTGDWIKLEGSYRYLNDDVTLIVESVGSATASYYIDDFIFEDTGSESTPSIKDAYKDYFKITNIPGNTVFLNPGTGENAFYNYHFGGVTIGNQLKPDSLQKNKGTFTFGTADAMIAKAQSQGQDIHGHVLVWHSQTPAWFNQKVDTSGNALKDEAGNSLYLSRDEALNNMTTHIKTVMEHYEGIPESWDVVNEAMEDDPHPVTDWKDALRKSAWYYSVGPDFIEQAFLAAKEVLDNHPEWGDLKLYYNDFNEDFPVKRDAIYDMVKELNDRYASTHPGKLLIDGIGMQSHYDMRTKPAEVEASLEKFASLGVKVAISELDILAGMNSSLSPEWAEKQGSLYAQLFQIYKKHADKISRMTIWGPYETTSWRVSQNPCLFDGKLSPKPAYYAVIDPDKFLAEHLFYTAPEIKSSTALYGRPDIDGTIDDVWKNAPEIQIDNQLMASSGAYGTAKTLWDDENLYVLFQVKDTQLSKDNADKTKQDSVEAYVDEDRINAWPYREDDGEYRVNFMGEQSFKFLSNSTPAVSPGFESAAIMAGTDYTVEMKIPFKTITPENGTQIRFDAQVNNAIGANLIGVATWNDLLGRATKSTEVFGSLTLSGKGDPTPPAWAEGSKLEASNVTSTGVTLSWPAAADNLGVTGYRIYNGVDTEPISLTGGEYSETVTGAVYHHQVTALIPNTQYTFKVEAGDAAGGWSTNGPSVTVTTLSSADTTPPVWAEGSSLEASNVTSRRLTLIWSATAADEGGIAGYRITNGVDDKPITVTDAVYTVTVTGAVYSHQVTGLKPDTQYIFKVEAGDTGGNWSTDGPKTLVTTLSNSGGPSVPTPTPMPTPGATVPPTPTPIQAIVSPTQTPASTSAPTAAPASTFKDLGSKYSWAAEAIDKLYGLGIIKGTSGTTFSPEKNITRADFVLLLVRALGLEAEAGSSFADVSQGAYYAEAVSIAKKLGIIQGMDGNNFNPKGEISRQDMMVITARALKAGNKLSSSGSAGDLSGYTDRTKVAKYAVDSVAALVKEGIIQGDGKSIHPTGTATRAEAAVIIYRIYGR